MFIFVHSQGAEQLNRVLKRLASSVSYMTARNFRLTLSVFMAGQNHLRMESWHMGVNLVPGDGTVIESNDEDEDDEDDPTEEQ